MRSLGPNARTFKNVERGPLVTPPGDNRAELGESYSIRLISDGARFRSLKGMKTLFAVNIFSTEYAVG